MGSFVLDGQQHMGIRPAGKSIHLASFVPLPSIMPATPVTSVTLSYRRDDQH